MEKSADELLATEWWRATDADVLAAIADAEELHRRAYAVTLAVHAEARTRNLTGGYDSTRVAIHDAARISVIEAARREKHLDLLDSSTLARTAVASGEVGAEHLDVITNTLAAIPADTGLDDHEAAESLFVDQARTLDARGLRNAARDILAWLDQDGPEPADAPESPVNALHLDTARDGRSHLTGHLGPEAGALLTGLLSPLASSATRR